MIGGQSAFALKYSNSDAYDLMHMDVNYNMTPQYLEYSDRLSQSGVKFVSSHCNPVGDIVTLPGGHNIMYGMVSGPVSVGRDGLRLIFDIDNACENAFGVNIPKSLFSPPFIVFLDGEEILTQITEFNDFTNIQTTLPAGTHRLEIVGNDSIPLDIDIYIDIASGSNIPGCEVINACYLPATHSITPGRTVTWTNIDAAAHTVTSGYVPEPDGIFDSGLIMPSEMFSHRFDTPGTYPYFCLVHPWMTGDIVVGGTPSASIILLPLSVLDSSGNLVESGTSDGTYIFRTGIRNSGSLPVSGVTFELLVDGVAISSLTSSLTYNQGQEYPLEISGEISGAGVHTITLTARDGNGTALGATSREFTITPTESVTITNAIMTVSGQTTSSIASGQTGVLTVEIYSTTARPAAVYITGYASDGTPISLTLITGELNPGTNTVSTTITILPTVVTGPAAFDIVALSGEFGLGGTPIAAPYMMPFEIVPASTGSTPPTSSSRYDESYDDTYDAQYDANFD